MFDPSLNDHFVIPKAGFHRERNGQTSASSRNVALPLQPVDRVDSGRFETGSLKRLTGSPIGDALSRSA
jgi:hypothetical protein